MNIKSSIKAPARRLIFTLGRIRHSLFTEKPLDIANIKSILLVQLGGIGDVLLTFPILDALMRLSPDRQILTLTEHGDWLFKLFPGNSDQLKHYVLDMSSNYRDKLKQLTNIRRNCVDLVLCPSRGDGMAESSVVSMLCGARRRIGFGWKGSKLLYTHTLPFSTEQPVWKQNFELLQLLGINEAPSVLEINVPGNIEIKQYLVPAVSDDPVGPIIMFHPWAGNFAHLKTWPLEKYVELACMLIQSKHATIYILGSLADKDSGKELCTAVGSASCINICGQLSFAETVAMIKHANLLVGNDSSLLHVASGVHTPSVGIFGSTSPEQLMHPDSGCHIVNINVECGPCYLHQPWFTHKCNQGIKCLNNISVDKVYMAVVDTLTSGKPEK